MARCLNLRADTVTGYACNRPNENFGDVEEIKIMEDTDITSLSIRGRVVTWTIGTKGVAIPAVNASVLLNIATKGGETYNLSYDPTITVVAPADFYSSAEGGAVEGSLGGSQGWIIALKFSSGNHYVVGLKSPLSLLSIEGVNNVNANATLTFGVDDWQTGTTIYKITQAEYDKA